MVCPRCGKAFDRPMRFCDACGTPLTQGQMNAGGQRMNGQRMAPPNTGPQRNMGSQRNVGPQGRPGQAGPGMGARGMQGMNSIPGLQLNNPLWVAAAVGCLVLILSLFLPYYSIGAYGITQSTSMMGFGQIGSGAGFIPFVYLILAGCCLAFLIMNKLIWAMFVAVAELNWVLIGMMVLDKAVGMVGSSSVSRGIGYWLWLLGGLAMGVCTIILCVIAEKRNGIFKR